MRGILLIVLLMAVGCVGSNPDYVDMVCEIDVVQPYVQTIESKGGSCVKSKDGTLGFDDHRGNILTLQLSEERSPDRPGMMLMSNFDTDFFRGQCPNGFPTFGFGQFHQDVGGLDWELLVAFGCPGADDLLQAEVFYRYPSDVIFR